MPNKRLAAGVMAAFSVSALLAQDKPKPTTAPGSPHTGIVERPTLTALPSLRIPARLSECEAQVCGVWEFSGQAGAARWPGGAVATLTVERFDSDGIVIRRTDTGGSTPGLTAIYTGKMTGSRIDGDVTWSWSGFRNKTATAKWYATIGASAPRQNQGPTVSVRNPGAALLMGILGIQPDGSRAPTDWPEKISRLERAADASCSYNVRNDDGGACERNREYARDKLSEARAELSEEIDLLQEAHGKLTPECKKGNKESCKTLAKVDAQLERDQR